MDYPEITFLCLGMMELDTVKAKLLHVYQVIPVSVPESGCPLAWKRYITNWGITFGKFDRQTETNRFSK